MAKLGHEARWLARVAGRLVGSSALAEDACQDTWLKAHRERRGELPSRGDLVRRVRGFASVARRGERRRRDREAKAARPEQLPSAAEIAMQTEQLERMWGAVGELEESLRTTLLLHYRHGATTGEIAERLELAPDTVRWRLRKGVAELRSRLDRDQVGGGLGALGVLFQTEKLPVAAAFKGGAALSAVSLSLPKLGLGALALLAASLLFWFRTADPVSVPQEAGVAAPAKPGSTVPVAAADEERSGSAPPGSASKDPSGTRQAASLLARSSESGHWTLMAVDEDGQPVAGAAVKMTFPGDPSGTPQGSLGATGEDGCFSVEGLGRQPSSVWTEKAGYQNGYLELRQRSDAGPDLGSLVMLPASLLYAQVIDDFGRGIPGAVIYPERPKELNGTWSLPPGREDWRVTDRDGLGTWTNLRPGTRRFLIHSDHHRARIVTWDEGSRDGTKPGSPVRWSLSTGEKVRGRVTGLPKGDPRTFRVSAYLLQGTFGHDDYLGGPSLGFFSISPWSVVAPDGGFTLEGLHPGASYRLCLGELSENADAFSRNLGIMEVDSLSEPRDVKAGESAAELLWREPATVSFRIAVPGGDSEGAPVHASTKNRALSAALGRRGSLVPSATGSYTIKTLPTGPGVAQLTVALKGFVPRTVQVAPLGAGEAIDLGEIDLKPAPTVRIRVTDSVTGDAVRGGRVYASAEKPRPGPRSAIAITDESGLALVPYGESSTHGISVRHPDFAERVLSGVTLGNGDPLEVELSRGGSAAVTGVDGDPGARILCRPVSGEAALGAQIRRSNRLASLRILLQTTDDGGATEFQHLPRGEYEFVQLDRELAVADGARLRDPAPWPGSVRAFVDEGHEVQVNLGDGAEISLEGTLSMEGTPLVGATVSLFDPVAHSGKSLRRLQLMQQCPSSVSADDGTFLLKLAEGGDFVLVVQSDRCVVAQLEAVTITPGRNRVNLDLTRCVVSGQVLDPTGAPVPDQVVLAYQPKPSEDPLKYVFSEHRVRTGSDGRYRLAGLPAGVGLSIQSHGRGWQGATAPTITLEAHEIREGLDLVTDRAADLVVSLTRPAPASGDSHLEARLLEANANGASGAWKPATLRRTVSVNTAETSATLEDLAPGRYVVEWREGPRVLASQETEVALHKTNRVTLSEDRR